MLDVMLSSNKTELNYALSQFKHQGIIQFDKILSISRDQRIPSIVKTLEERMKVSAAITAAIKSAFDNINLRIGLTPDQTVEIAEQIIDQSEEDYLSLEDVLLFLQQLITGKAGKIYDRMDVPTFFELFENYRQERYAQLVRIREERNQNLKSQGLTERTNNPDPISEAMLNYGNKMNEMKEKLKEQREINRMKTFEKNL